MTVAWKILAATIAAATAVAFTAFARAPAVIWNASASVPLGLYRVQPIEQLQVGDLVVVRPPEALASTLADGGYLPRGVPLLKRVAALSAQRVCRTVLAITVDGVLLGVALDQDRHGRPLPVWQGCIALGPDQVFLLNPNRPDSLDGRYFGPLPLASIVGRARPLWTDEAR